MDQPIGFLFADQDEYAKFLFECNKALKRRGHMIFQTTLVDKKKNKHLMEISVAAVDKTNLSSGILLNFTEVDNQSNAIDESNENTSFIQSIIENLEIPLLQIRNQKIEWVNENLCEVLQYSAEELLGSDISLLFQSKSASRLFLSEMNRSFLSKRNYVGEISIIRKDKLPIGFNARAITGNYEAYSSSFIFLEPNNELKNLINQLRDEKNQLEFYSDLLFHDVRNLCQDALLQIDLSIRNTKSSPDDSIKKQNKSRLEIIRIGELISNIDKYFKTKRKDYDLYSLDVSKSFEKALEKIKVKFDARELNIKHNLKKGRYFAIANDWLEDVFFNLLDNAVRYDRNTNATVEISIEKSLEHQNYWKITFLDNGPGIGDELKKNLFDRYVRSKGTIHGSGFGLTLVKVIVDSYNGFISVEDRDPMNRSKGSRFILQIPMSRYD